MQKIMKWGVITILYLTYFLATLLNSDLFGNLLSPIVTLLTSYYVLKGYTIKCEDRILRIFGLLLALSLLNWAICDCLWAISDLLYHIEPTGLNVFDYGYSITNILVLVSLIILTIGEAKKWNIVQLFVDAIAVSFCFLIVIWVLFFDKKFSNVIRIHADIIFFITILINFLIIVGILIWYFSIQKRKIHLYLIITIVGIVLFAILDLIYYYLMFFSKYDANSLLDAAYVISFIIMAWGSGLKLKGNNTLKGNEKIGFHKNRNSILLLFAPIILAIANKLNLEYLIFLFLIISIYFVLSDYIQKNIYKNELLLREKELNEALEHKVRDRTEKLNYLLDRDLITGFYNRRYFLNQLDGIVSKCNEPHRIVAFLIELNKYKMVKTVYGNSTGEKVITQMGVRLQKIEEELNENKDSVFSIYGEDIFAMVIKGHYDYDSAFLIAENIIDTCSEIYQIDEYDIKVTVNLGLSIYPLDAKNKEELLKNADWAKIQAEIYGYNQAKAFDVQLSEQMLKKSIIEMKLKKINYDKEFFLYYQPQLLIENREVIGFEALIRWKTDSGAFISPAEFIPIAEESGSIIPVGEWVLERALLQVCEWNQNSRLKYKMAINVSAKQLSRDFIKKLDTELKKYKISPDQIEVEITENIHMEANLEILNLLNEINEMGITIAIDDFGTGYSSLYYLNSLPVHRLKIARELIDRIDKNIFDYTLIKMLIETAKVRGIKVIAEGVETQAQWDCLCDLHCDEVQGYFVGKPVPAKEIAEKWLKIQ